MNKTKQKKEIVQFFEERTFGDIIGAPFQFIIQEFKPFAGSLLKFAGPFVALAFLAVSLLANDIYSSVVMNGSVSDSTAVYGVILAIALILGMLAVTVTTHSYITLYVDKGKGNFTKDDVGDLLKKNVWKVFGAGILVYIMVFIGMLLIYIPGIYLVIALSFVFLIIIYENADAGKSISRSFEVIKGRWWQTFGLILVFGMIIGATSYVFIIPIYAVIIAAAISGTQIGTGSVILLTLFVFLYFTAYLFFMSMQQIMIAFQYFSISAGKNGVRLKDRIAAINEDDFEENSENTVTEKDETGKIKKSEEPNRNRFSENDNDINRFKPKQ